MIDIDWQRIAAATVSSVFLALAWLFVGLRCYTRLIVKKQFGADDVYAIAGLLTFTACCILQLLSVKDGLGEHLWTLSPVQIAQIIKYNLFRELCYVVSTCLTKLSFGITILRITTVKFQVYTTYSLMTTVTLYSISYAILLLTNCQPVSYLWDQVLGSTTGHCGPARLYYATYVHSAIILVTNITLAIIPILLVWPLQLNFRTKVSVACLFAFGSIASIATIARVPLLHFMQDRSDFIYNNTPMTIWATAEAGTSIVIAAAATLRPLLQTTKRFALNTPECGPHISGNPGKLRPFKFGGYMTTLTERSISYVKPRDRKRIRVANEERIKALREIPVTPPPGIDEFEMESRPESMDGYYKEGTSSESDMPCVTGAESRASMELEGGKDDDVERDDGDIV